MSVCKLRRIAEVVTGLWLVGCARGDIVLGTGAMVAPNAASGTFTPALDAGEAPSSAGQAASQVVAANSVGQGSPAMVATSNLPSGGATVPPPTASVEDDAGTPKPVDRPSVGCGQEPVRPALRVRGRAASFLLDVPAAYDKRQAYPLVLAFRGVDTSTAEFRAQLDLGSIADALIVYPDPLDSATPWQFQRDMDLVDELISGLGAAYCVDQDRVFAIGDESGGLFANLVGCVRADQVRAIATLSSAPPPPGPCFGNTAVWLLQRTDLDPNTVGSGLGNRDFWAARNGCNVLDPQPVAPTPCVAYAGCTQELPVHFCEYAGSTWPSFAITGAWQFFESL